MKELFIRCQRDFQTAWGLQHQVFEEFDSMTLLDRAKLDQQTFAAFVGARYTEKWNKWKWQGRKNTARNKLIGILAHMLAGMLYPFVHAQNEENEEDKLSARVMRILVEERLRSANYELKFLYMVLSALVNPAVLVNVEYLEATQRIKQQLKDGKVKIREAVDTFLTGLSLAIKPIDQVLVADFYTPDIQSQPYIIELERIPWDTARKIYGKYDDFKYVQSGMTRLFMGDSDTGQLYDIQWTEADQNYVQVLTFRYRDEDIEARWVGGVFMGEKDNVYNKNPFSHRRFSLIENEWVSIPIYPYAKGIFEPLDPTGRFFYGKSGAFKEYWDDATQNKMHQLLIDGTYLDVFKPTFLSGTLKMDSTVMAPAAVITMPKDASMSQYALGPNLAAAQNAMNQQIADMSESTQDKIMQGSPTPNVTATQSIQAQNQARIFLGVFSFMVADLIRQVGELVVDCIVQHTLSPELDATLPGTLRMKQKTLLAKSKEQGKDITNRIVLTDAFMGKQMTQSEADEYEFRLYDEVKDQTDQAIYHVNPYKFARIKYSMYIDPDQISNAAMGNDRMRKLASFQILTDPRIAPFTDPKAVADEVIEEFSVGDPDKFKAKGNVNDIMQSIMGQAPQSPQAKAQRSASPQRQMIEAMT